MDSYIRYTGFADKNYKVKGLENWFPIEDTEEAIKKSDRHWLYSYFLYVL